MSSKTVDKHNAAFKARLAKAVKKALKQNRQIRNMAASFKQHFKKDKWALGYELNREHLNPYAFNVLLEILNYRIYYSAKFASIVFKPRRTK